ncbi:GNAT family N-acetyltransferase [Rubinisphaera margarita]|uniref:GNAT family N-acetyltransferase n=1 Tax=Rubinisphaera margarita TaxID=2909586 RepID=UPI001EE93E69|nr:GNAT family N-acetyltransferase [Rubinisphaera margarita]MCG6154992.1 GNAT family N-acetyltransferase [Rubinisphaera margarita]
MPATLSHPEQSRAPAPERIRSERPYASRIVIDDQMWAEVIENPADLQSYLQGWNELARAAVVPNVFYEPWFLRPAIEYLHSGKPLRFVFIYRKNKRISDPDILCGFFPLERTRIKLFPAESWRLMTDSYLYLSQPLLHVEYTNEAVLGFLRWARLARIPLIELSRSRAEGPYLHALTTAFRQLEITPFIYEQTTRALLVREDGPAVVSQKRGHYRRDIQRRRRRLEENGAVEVRYLNSSDDLEEWQQNFLRLERVGWKGESGTAIALHENETRMFLETTTAAMQQGHLQMLGLYFEGAPIAIKCNLCSEEGSYAWRIAFDESYARYSPGVQLELDNMECFRRTPLKWMDSCATADHPMINRLWPHRLGLQSLYVPTCGLLSDIYCSTRPLLRITKRRLKALLGRR